MGGFFLLMGAIFSESGGFYLVEGNVEMFLLRFFLE